jgi:plasmid maintenance system antidote protein VapI
MTKTDEFQPSWASAPGETIADILEERGLSLADFAEKIGQTSTYVADLIAGRAFISGEIARRLEAILGSSAEFWTRREHQYRNDAARLQHAERRAQNEWLREIPVGDMIKFGWLSPGVTTAEKAVACLRFFDVPDVVAWRRTYARMLDTVAFKTSATFDSELGSVAAWLRKGEIESESIECLPWSVDKFHETIVGIRSLTKRKDPKLFVAELQGRCARSGVAVVIARAPAGCRASGATRFVSTNKALLLLSFRYLSDDHFWFAFFHEAGHLILHDKEALFLDGPKTSSSKEEEAANQFAANTLIPQESRPALLSLGSDWREIVRFAGQVGVSPGIVVGQLQHLGRIRRNQFNSLKRRYKWVAD